MNTRPGGHNMIFTDNNGKIYYNDMRNNEGVSMLNTVEENRKQYTQQQYKCAKITRQFTRQWVIFQLNTIKKLLIQMQ